MLLDNLMMGAPASAGFPVDPGALAEQQAAQEARDAAAARLMRQRHTPAFGIGATPPIGMLDEMPGMAMATAPGAAPTMPSGAPTDMAAMMGGAPAGGPVAGAGPPMAPPPMMADPSQEAAPATPGTPEWLRLMSQAPLSNPTPATIADPASLPATSAPTAGTDGPAVPPASLLGRVHDWINNHQSTLMALGSGMAGAQSLGQGLNRGGTLAIPAMQADIKQQQQTATVAALMKRGLPQDAAVAAASNKEVLQQLLPQMFGAKQRQFTQIGEDMLGNKKFGFVDPVSNKVYNLDGSEYSAASGGAGNIPNGPDGQTLSGQPLMEHLQKTDPVTAAGIKGLIEGDLNAQGRNLQKLAPLAKLVDPTFDATQYPIRLNVRKSYTSGKDFAETQALNTVGGHMGRLMDAADGLDNSNWKPINKLSNWYHDTFTGSPALVKFRNDLVTTQNELAKAYHGGHVSDSAFAAFNKSINEAQTPAELKTAIGELAGLLQSKIEAKESGYRASMAGAPIPAEYRAINDEAKHSFQKIGDWASGISQPRAIAGGPASSAAAPRAAAAAPLKSGNYIWTPDKGLVPAQ